MSFQEVACTLKKWTRVNRSAINFSSRSHRCHMLTYLLLDCREWGRLGWAFLLFRCRKSKYSNSLSAITLGCPDAMIFRKLNWISDTNPTGSVQQVSQNKVPVTDWWAINGQKEPTWYLWWRWMNGHQLVSSFVSPSVSRTKLSRRDTIEVVVYWICTFNKRSVLSQIEPQERQEGYRQRLPWALLKQRRLLMNASRLKCPFSHSNVLFKISLIGRKMLLEKSGVFKNGKRGG